MAHAKSDANQAEQQPALSSTEQTVAEDPRKWRETIRDNLYDKYAQEMQANGNAVMFALQANTKIIQDMTNLPQIPEEGQRISKVTYEQANQVLQAAIHHPVVGMHMYPKYDPDLVLGFCFGRATFAHLELIRRGVRKEAIEKVFIIGPMKTGDINWQFHVATIVRAVDGQWLAIDPNFPEVKTLGAWYNHYKNYSVDSKVRLYITHPSKIGPSGWEYNNLPGGLKDPIYKNYFEDMFKTFKGPVEVSYKRPLCSRVHKAVVTSPVAPARQGFLHLLAL